MTDAQAVWAAVSSLVDPSRVKVERVADADWLDELAGVFRKLGVCDVEAYRAATRSYAEIPSLWDQATDALGTGYGEGSISSPLRERSPADLDLMEVRSIIRDHTRTELEKLGVKTQFDEFGRQASFNPTEIRSLASLVTSATELYTPDYAWWEYRFSSWARMLSTYLRAHDHQPKPVRLRNAPCPLCKTKQITIDGEYGPVVAPPILIDFHDGMVRAATCQACNAAWFRGPQLEQLAAEIANQSVPDERISM